MTTDPGPGPDTDPLDAPSTVDLGLQLLALVRDNLLQVTALSTAERVDEALRALGWDPDVIAVSELLANAVQALSQTLAPFETAIDLQRSPAFLDVVAALPAIGAKISEVTGLLTGWTPPTGAPANTKEVLLQDLLEGLPLEALTARFPLSVLLLALLGALRDEPVAGISLPNGSVVRQAGSQRRADLAPLAQALHDPLGALRANLIEDAAGARRTAPVIMDAVAKLVADPLMATSASARYPLPATDVPSGLTGLASSDHLMAITLTFTDATTLLPGQLRLVLGLTDDTGGEGLGLLIAAQGSLSVSKMTAAGSFTAGLTAGSEPLLLTGNGIRLANSSAGTLPPVDVSFSYASGDVLPLIRLGASDSTRFEVDRLKVDLGAHLNAGPPDFSASVTATGTRLVVQAPEDDGFLTTVLGTRPIETDIELGLDWSLRNGLHIRGGAGLAVELPIGQAVGPFTVDTVMLGLNIALDTTPAFTVDFALSVGFALGPFSAAVQSMGIAALIDSPPQPGNLGPARLTLRPKPPAGAGLAIKSPAVSGGGFLSFDPDAGQYAGVFELTIVGTVAVKAIAIITTKMPDGSPGFALLILITAEGFTPVQLGMGFSLTGIGGLLALNHTVDADVVSGGLRSGVLDSVLFVKDPVKNAPRVISTLNHVFPLAADRLLIGPLAEISWGTPPLVKIRLALLLEVPQPIRVILLAALSMTLPTPQDAVVVINIDSIGVLDFGKRELALDASLHDSRILKFTLTGDMALRLNWGDEPTFLVSLGGFHPRFTPPKGLRPLNRLALTLSSGDNPRVRFEAYLALTSNTIQMGARVDVHAVEGAFALDGGGSFDALIQWSPFALDVAFAAWAKITSGGSTLLAASIAVDVTGPRPWHLTGQASVQVLVFTVTVGVDFTIGAPPSAPEVTVTLDVGAAIWAQLSDPASWAATLPPTATPGVTLAGLPAASDATPLVAHPLATVSVQQQVAPLGTPIERVGGRLPVGGTRSYVASVSAPAGIVGGTVKEMFAPGQYANLSDDARLAGPSFAPMTGGVSLTPETAAAAGPLLSCDLAVQTLEVTSLDTPATPGAWVAVEAGVASGPVPAQAPRLGQVTT